MSNCSEDPAALHIATNDSLAVLHNQAEQVVRESCSKLPLLGEPGHDIRTLGADLSQVCIRLEAFGQPLLSTPFSRTSVPHRPSLFTGTHCSMLAQISSWDITLNRFPYAPRPARFAMLTSRT